MRNLNLANKGSKYNYVCWIERMCRSRCFKWSLEGVWPNLKPLPLSVWTRDIKTLVTVENHTYLCKYQNDKKVNPMTIDVKCLEQHIPEIAKNIRYLLVWKNILFLLYCEYSVVLLDQLFLPAFFAYAELLVLTLAQHVSALVL